ncbi:MAG: divergent polysaccharide deacetylase family protein [Rhodospirillales bacterium]|nr:divergent polysaccharide deacetylase family protein [Rhodospirillales bacterium]
MKSPLYKPPVIKPNPIRQFLWVILVLAGIAAGYAINLAITWNEAPPAVEQPETGSKPLAASPNQTAAKKESKPWFRSQPPPPKLFKAPDTPLFPDPHNGNGAAPETVLAYEESLPQEIYETKAAEAVEPARKLVNAIADPAPYTQPPAATPSPASVKQPAQPNTLEKVTPSQPQPRSAGTQMAALSPGPDIRPVIVLVIDDMGVDQKRSAKIIALKGPLTLSFLTYARDLARQTAAARKAGHELMLHVSMEPQSKSVDPGPNVLLVGLDSAELRRRLVWGLDRFQGFVGINNHMGSKFTGNADGMQVVMDVLKERRLFFLDSRTSGRTVGAKLARLAGVPVVERNIFLDNVNDEAAVLARLAETERLARRQGVAIAIGHPRDGTLKALGKWLPQVDSKGFRLLPITAVIPKPKKSG